MANKSISKKHVSRKNASRKNKTKKNASRKNASRKNVARKRRSINKKGKNRKYYGVASEIFEKYLKLDENVHRIIGDSATENMIRKDINEQGRDVLDKSEPELLANEFLFLERLYKGMIDENGKIVDKNSSVSKKHIDERGYYNILDDLYNEETPDDYDAFAIKTNPNYESVKDILDSYDPDNKDSNKSSVLQKKIVRESDNNRGFFSTDKPRGPKIRYAEKAKRKVVELTGRAVDAAGSIVDKVSTSVSNLAELAGKAVDIANAGIASSTKAARIVEQGVNTVGTASNVVTSSLKAVGNIANAGADLIEHAGSTLVEVVKTGSKALDIGTASLKTVQKVGDVAIDVAKIAGTGVEIVGSGVKIAGSAADIAASTTKVIAAGAARAATEVGKLATKAVSAISK
jgi:hypothetical protein